MVDNSNFASNLIHKGDGQFQKGLNKSASTPETLPIYHTSAFAFDDVESVDEIYEKKADGYIYSRMAAPNADAVSEIIAAADNAQGALVFASGMAAITTTIFSLVESGDHIVASKVLYGAVFSFLSKELKRFGVEVSFADLTNDDIEKFIKPNTKFIYTETISNPLMEVPDISAISEIAHKHNLLLVIDNTFASPAIAQVLSWGADIALYSATKYLSGHNDIIGGAVSVKTKDLFDKIKRLQVLYGAILPPFDSWLLARSLRTLDLRMAKHSQNALEIAKFLENHPKIEKVFYSGLESSPSHNTAAKQFKDGRFGGMMSVNLKGGEKEAISLINNLEHIFFVPSLAGTATTVSYSAKTSHRFYSKQERLSAGITDSQVRLSVGLEDSLYIIDELERALDK